MSKPLHAKQDFLVFMRQLYDDMGFSGLKTLRENPTEIDPMINE
jgi:hypothetical protein